MINYFYRSFRMISSSQKNQFSIPKSQITKSQIRLNYIPFINFSVQKKQNLLINSKLRIAMFNQNMTHNQIFQELQENIYDSIHKFEASDIEKKLSILNHIQSFFQIYMDILVKQKGSLISIDKNIIEFVENKLSSVLNEIKELEAYLGVETEQWQITELNKFQIQIKFLLHFENMELSEKKQLYKLYQTLNEKSLTFNPSIGFKYSCYYRAHTLFLYLSQKWNETAILSPTLSQIVSYSIIQLLNTLDELYLFDEGVQKQLIFSSYLIIDQLIREHDVLLFPRIQKLILKVVSKFQEVLKQYQHILSIDHWPAIMINLIIYSLKLGYIEIAQKDAISLYEGLNQQKLTSNREYQVCIELLYYCLRKTENSSYNMDELVEKIQLIETDQNFQPLQKLSVDIHQLNKLIEQQKYEQLEPVIDKILKLLFSSTDFKLFVMVPLVCEAIIFNPKIPNRINYLKKLQEVLSKGFDCSWYTFVQIQMLKHVFSLIISLENNNNKFIEFSSEIKSLVETFFNKECITIEKEIINCIIKLNPVIESSKTYKMLTEIIDMLLIQLKKDKENEQYKKWIEIWNEQKMKLRQKYYIKQQ